MSSKGDELPKEVVGDKKKDNPLKIKNLEDKNQYQMEENGIIISTYKLDQNLFEQDKYIRLFGENFIKKNKDRCSIVIVGKECEIVSMIDIEKFEKYGINKEAETLTVIFKGKAIDDISYMFKGSESLIKVDLSAFKTQNVTDMKDLFDGCISLIQADLSFINTQNVIDMRCMFNFCTNLIKVNLSSFETKNVTDMRCMFNFCKSLMKIDLSSFNTKNVTNVSRMFTGCDSIIKIKRKKFHKIKSDLNLIDSELFILEI